jgi:hypothetical protein
MKELKFYLGSNIDTAHKVLVEFSEKYNEPCCGNFNGKVISSSDSIDEAYVKVTGITKQQYDEYQKMQRMEYEDREKSHKERIPQLTEEYRKKARGIIPEENLELWDKIVPIRLSDLYHGMELDCWLDLISVLNDEVLDETDKLIQCAEIFDSQGHSGMSASLVMSGLIQFHPLGKKLVDYINSNHK